MVNGLPPQQQQEQSQAQGPTSHPQTDLIGEMFNPQGSRDGPITVPISSSSSSRVTHDNNQKEQDGSGSSPSQQPSQEPGQPQVLCEDPTNHTNKYEIETFFVHEIMAGSWLTSKGEPIPSCDVDEAWGLAQTVVENLLKAASTKEGFLINLAALAGGKLLMPCGGLKITRLESELPGQNRYSCDWQLQYGDLRGSFSMQETVFDEKWKNGAATAVPVATVSHNNKRKRGGSVNGAASEDNTADKSSAMANGRGSSNGVAGEGEEKESSKWKLRYEQMAQMVQQRDQELARLRSMIVEALKDSRHPSQPSTHPLPVDV